MPTTPKGQTLNLADKLAAVPGPWQPHVVAELNDVQFKVVRLDGDFVWHRHDDTDEAFLVLAGTLEVAFREAGGERVETIGPGEMIVVPRGAEHITRAHAECHALIVEPRGVVNTGERTELDDDDDLTAAMDVWL